MAEYIKYLYKTVRKFHGIAGVVTQELNDVIDSPIVKEAIINYVAMLGCSYEDGRDMYSLSDLEKLFDIKHLNKAPAVFDYKKLEWFNGQYMREKTDEELFELTWPFIANSGMFGEQDQKARETAGLRFADQTLLKPTDAQKSMLMNSKTLRYDTALPAFRPLSYLKTEKK